LSALLAAHNSGFFPISINRIDLSIKITLQQRFQHTDVVSTFFFIDFASPSLTPSRQLEH
jgi:hypothetical protein